MRYWQPKSFKKKPLLSIIIACYLPGYPRRRDSLLSLLYAFRAQTYENWEAVVVHDGPIDAPLVEMTDPRVKVISTPERKQQFGHPWRKWAIEKHTTGAYVGMANDDNWYAPVYFESMAHELFNIGGDFAYCNMVHSHKLWKPFETKPTKGRIDVGCWMAKRELVVGTPWTDMSFNGDGTFVEAMIAKARNVRKLKEYLFVHN